MPPCKRQIEIFRRFIMPKSHFPPLLLILFFFFRFLHARPITPPPLTPFAATIDVFATPFHHVWLLTPRLPYYFLSRCRRRHYFADFFTIDFLDFPPSDFAPRRRSSRVAAKRRCRDTPVRREAAAKALIRSAPRCSDAAAPPYLRRTACGAGVTPQYAC